ncbi:hypothetical protein [Persicobacter sp. CCB-QB2]|uniref:hypothetical protein n=1 Tax=Persicobacter sp. CCB-QB2 TaxID=1561025 RepID=UPI0006A9BDBA|nr:hypothetical protein [Persicobacter sp. CCB-QB2]
MSQIIINPAFKPFADIIEEIPFLFQNSSPLKEKPQHLTLQKEHRGISLSIHFFSDKDGGSIRDKTPKPTAGRAYDNAWKLIQLGLRSPEPLAWMDTDHSFLLGKGSVYITHQESGLGSLTSVFQKAPDKEKLTEKLLHFILEDLQARQIGHHHLNGENIGVHLKNGHYTFSIEEPQGIRFDQPFTKESRLLQLQQLSQEPELLFDLAQAFADQQNEDFSEVIFNIFQQDVKMNFLHHLTYHKQPIIKRRTSLTYTEILASSNPTKNQQNHKILKNS